MTFDEVLAGLRNVEWVEDERTWNPADQAACILAIAEEVERLRGIVAGACPCDQAAEVSGLVVKFRPSGEPCQLTDTEGRPYETRDIDGVSFDIAYARCEAIGGRCDMELCYRKSAADRWTVLADRKTEPFILASDEICMQWLPYSPIKLELSLPKRQVNPSLFPSAEDIAKIQAALDDGKCLPVKDGVVEEPGYNPIPQLPDTPPGWTSTDGVTKYEPESEGDRLMKFFKEGS